jgi:F0F1-type ATP synthase membrane subunit b/b'
VTHRPESPLEEILRKGEQARALLTELRQGLKDAKRELAELHAEHERWIETEGRRLTDRIDTRVREGLDNYQATLGRAIEDAVAVVNRRFDVISAIMLGEEQGDGAPSMAELATEVRRVRDYERGQQRANRAPAGGAS